MLKPENSSGKPAFQDRREISIPSALPLGVPAGIAIIVIAVFLAYLPSINGGFVLDDGGLLTKNELINASDGLYRFWCTTEPYDYWPLTNTTLWIEWRLWGTNPTGYHVTNLILHVAETLLIWIILRKLSIPGAFLAAMLFAMHPVNVESVAWIAQRKDMLAVLFFLLSILCYLKSEIPWPLAPSPWPLFYWLSLIMFLLAMLSKGSTAVLPVLLLGIVCWRRKAGTVPIFASMKMGLSPSISPWDLLRIAPFFAVALILGGVNVWFQTHGSASVIRTAGFTERLLGAGGVVWFYLYKALFPVDLAFIYPQWHIDVGNPLWWLPLMAALAVTAMLWRYRKTKSRSLLFAWGFFCVALVPVLGFTDVGFMEHSLVADHYQHIALIGVITLAAALWNLWRHRVALASRQCWAVNVVAILAVVALALLTWRQSGLFRDEITFYQAALEKNPDCWLAHNNLGLALAETLRPQEAIKHYNQALRLNPDYHDAHYNLADALFKALRPQEAIEHYRQALRLKPDYPDTHNNLGGALVQTLRPREAIEQCEQALRLKPDFPEAHMNLGAALAQTGRLREAIEHYEQALRLKPDYPEALNHLGIALAQTGRLREAIECYGQALRLKPDYPEALSNLGITLVQTDRLQEAIERFQQALRLKPDYPEALNNLGKTFIIAGRLQEAVAHLVQAIGLKSDYIEAHFNLALAYAGMQQSAAAIAAAEKALELARSQGQTALAKQIEDWLNSYRASPSDIQNTPPPAQSPPQTP